MNDKKFKKLEDKIARLTTKLEKLQRKYIRETGVRYYEFKLLRRGK